MYEKHSEIMRTIHSQGRKFSEFKPLVTGSRDKDFTETHIKSFTCSGTNDKNSSVN